MKKQVQERFKELEDGTKRQLQKSDASPDQQSSIMDYLKAGFFTALGVIAAFAVVDLIAGAFGGGDNSGGNDDSPKENDAAADDAVADDEEDVFGDNVFADNDNDIGGNVGFFNEGGGNNDWGDF